MTDYVIAFVSAALLAGVCYAMVSVYLELRRTSNRLLAVAQKQFSDSVNSLLETPKELPDEVLSVLRMMGKTAFEPRSELALLRHIKARRRSGGANGAMPIEALRPQLGELFGKAAAAWLNIMTHKSTVGGLRIAYALSKAEAAAGEIPVTPTTTALPAMREMATTGTAVHAA